MIGHPQLPAAALVHEREFLVLDARRVARVAAAVWWQRGLYRGRALSNEDCAVRLCGLIALLETPEQQVVRWRSC